MLAFHEAALTLSYPCEGSHEDRSIFLVEAKPTGPAPPAVITIEPSHEQ